MTRTIAFVRIQNQKVAVEIINVFTTGDGRRIASVEALPVNGKTIRPFTQYSIGGPSQSSEARIPVAFLTDIGFAVDMPAPTIAEVGSL